MKLMIVPIVAALLGAGSPPWQQQAIASASPFIDKANHEWETAVVSDDLDVLAAPYAPDALFVLPDGTPIRGVAAIRALYRGRPANVRLVRARLHSDRRVAVGPDDVYEWGSAEESLRTNVGVRRKAGRYLTVWHRTGHLWLITRNLTF